MGVYKPKLKVENQRRELSLKLLFFRHKAIALVSAVAYWILYAYSSGMFFYYPSDMTSLIESSPVPNPYFFIDARSLKDLYYSGMVWIPNGHLQLNIILGATFFSVLLSFLFGESMLLLIHRLRVRNFKKKTGFIGFAGFIPAIFSGGCCSVPLATLLLGSILPSSLLFSFEYRNPFLVNSAVSILMLTSLVYTKRKLGDSIPSARPENKIQL